MSSIQYHSVDPQAVKVYGEGQVADFIINNQRNIINGSVRLEGELRITTDGTNRPAKDADIGPNGNPTNLIYYNANTGAHNLVEAINFSRGGQNKEFLNNYGRLVNMVEKSSKSRNDYFNTEDLVELKVALMEDALMLSKGFSSGTNPRVISDVDFSFKPLCCLNRMNAPSLSLSDSNNECKLSFTFSQNNAFLVGENVANNSSYEIRNLRLTYRSADPSPTPNILSRSYVPLKLLLNNDNSSIQTSAPVVADAVSVSFLLSAHENNNTQNNVALHRPPGVDRMQFLFNSNTSEFITYEMKDVSEMVAKGLESMKSAGFNQTNPNKYAGNDGFLVGAPFDSQVDLSNQKFQFDFVSGISPAFPYLAFLYFHNVIEV